MKVYVVTESTPDYSNSSWAAKAVFATRELAEDYALKMAALPGIPREYGSGSESDYEVEEFEVWDRPTERLMLYHLSEYIDPGGLKGFNLLPGYRSEEYAPPGYAGYWRGEVYPPEKEGGWLHIRVIAPTPEEREARFNALYQEHWPQ